MIQFDLRIFFKMGWFNETNWKTNENTQLHREYNKPPNWIPINQPIEMPLVGSKYVVLPSVVAQNHLMGWTEVR